MYAGVTAVQVQLLLYQLATTTRTMFTSVRLTPTRHHSGTAETKTVDVSRNVEPVDWWRSVAVSKAPAGGTDSPDSVTS